MFVEKGKSIVKVNDYVGKGQLLVSGIIGTEKEPEIVSGKGNNKRDRLGIKRQWLFRLKLNFLYIMVRNKHSII